MTEDQWYEVIKRWERSGLTQLQFWAWFKSSIHMKATFDSI